MASLSIRMSMLLLSVLALCVMHAHASRADDRATGGGISRLIDAHFKAWRSSGAVIGCEVLYTVGYEDYVSRNGAMVLMRGSLAVTRTAQPQDAPIDVILKAAVLDFNGDTFAAAPMHSAFLMAAGRSQAGKDISAFPCEDEGLCSVYHGDAELARAIGAAFAVSYRRASDGGGVAVPVNLARTRPQVSADFAACAQALTGERK
jgi:hypothetical protein